MNFEVYRSFEEASHLIEAWNTMAAQSGTAEVSLTYDWNFALATANNLTPQLQILACFNGKNQLIGVCPLFKSQEKRMGISVQKIISVTGLYCAHNNLICTIAPRQFLAALLDFCHRDSRGWTYLSFASISEEAPLLEHIKPPHDLDGHLVVINPGECAPYLPISSDWTTFIRGKSDNFYSQITRKRKKLEKSGCLELRKFDSSDNLDELWSAVLEIEKHSWKMAEGSAIVNSPNQVRFYQQLLARAAKQGWLFSHLLYLDGKPIAHDLGLIFANKYYQLKNSFDSRWEAQSPGIVLRAIIMELLFESGVQECDFMWGTDPWKMRWTTYLRRHVSIEIVNQTSFSGRMLVGWNKIRQKI